MAVHLAALRMRRQRLHLRPMAAARQADAHPSSRCFRAGSSLRSPQECCRWQGCPGWRLCTTLLAQGGLALLALWAAVDSSPALRRCPAELAAAGLLWPRDVLRQKGQQPPPVPPPVPVPLVVNATFADSQGGCTIAIDTAGQMMATLSGWGTNGAARRCIGFVVEGLERLPDVKQLRALFDFRGGVGCSPFATIACARFVQQHGHRFRRIAVVAKGSPLWVARFIFSLADYQLVDFFDNTAAAWAWLRAL